MVRMEDDADADWTGAAKWSDSFKEPEAVFDILKIKEVLPHRYPFLLVDKIIEFEPQRYKFFSSTQNNSKTIILCLQLPQRMNTAALDLVP
mgnify:CR=1 FL=1